MLSVGVIEIVQVVCVIVFKCKSVFHVLNVKYVLVSKMWQVVSVR